MPSQRSARGRIVEAVEAARQLIQISVAIGWREGIAFGLEVSAAALATEEPLQVAELLGAAARIRGEIGVELEHFEQDIHERTATQLRAALGEERLGDAWHIGEALVEADAIGLALGRPDSGT